MPRTIVFIDGLVYDKDYLVSQFSSDIEYHVLDQNVDGISQMLEVLAGRSGFDSIQIISHGSPGSLTLGSTVLDNSSIGGYSSQLYTLGSSLNATGDLLLYGCGVGAGDVGRAFVDALAAATGADVAASDDATSGSAVGGDWELEVQAGDIAQAFSVLPSQYPFVLSSTADPVTSSTLLFPGHSMGQWSNAYAFAAIREDGSVVTWGDSRYGGDSTGVATQLNGYYDVIKVYSTNYAFAALREDGKVITWGLDSAGGNSVDTDLTKVVEVFSTHYAFAALREDGSVVAWSKGSCCGADTFPVASKLNGDIDVVEVFSTYEAFAALREDGSVVTWGDSTYGGGGNGLTALDGTTNVVQVFSTYGAFAALREDGSVVTWGNVSWGGNSSSVASKLDGSDDSRDVVQVFSTAYAFAALREDGSVVTWGNVSRGGNSSSVASKLDGSDDSRDVVQVFSTAYAFAALREDGSVVTWGHSVSGGDSSSVADELDGDVDVVDIFSDGGAFAALREDGSVVTWGASDWGG
ncbi:DUF4347 domain-containing protein, partial [Chlorobaculum sp. 24CR]|uniref:DUF4347 domain-containing protein n=1 Tax=Chlorobaculum sp. 24CR TaxID=2508878 RepID=UPI001431ACBD